MVKTYRKTKNTGVNIAARCFEALSHSTELRLNFDDSLYLHVNMKSAVLSEERLAGRTAYWTSTEVFWIITHVRLLHWSQVINKGLKIW